LADLPDLGKRGGGWVVLQFALMAAIVAAGVAGPPWPEHAAGPLAAVGVVLALAGAAAAAAAARSLGRGLTPLPRPRARGRLVERGPYRVVRHPIYSAGVLFFAGFSLAFGPAALALTAALAVLWALKARVEERFLAESFADYDAYCRGTRWRLVPFVY